MKLNIVYVSKEKKDSLIKELENNNLMLFSNLIEAIQPLLKNKIDILIVEIKNEQELIALKKIKNSIKETEIICFSEMNDKDYFQSLLSLKVFDYFNKNSLINDVISSTQNLISKKIQEKIYKIQIEEVRSLKENIEQNLPYVKLNSKNEIIYSNENFKKLNISFNDFCYENEKEKFIKYLNEVKNKCFVTNYFFFKTDNDCLKINIEFILENNLITNEENVILILKDVTKEHLENKNVKNHLIRKNSDIYIKAKEDKAEVITKAKKEITLLKERIEKLNLKIENLENNNLKTTDYSNGQKLKQLLKEEKYQGMKDRSRLNELENKYKKLSDENEIIKKERKEIKTKLEELEGTGYIFELKQEIAYLKDKELESDRKISEKEKEIKMLKAQNSLAAQLKKKVGMK